METDAKTFLQKNFEKIIAHYHIPTTKLSKPLSSDTNVLPPSSNQSGISGAIGATSSTDGIAGVAGPAGIGVAAIGAAVAAATITTTPIAVAATVGGAVGAAIGALYDKTTSHNDSIKGNRNPPSSTKKKNKPTSKDIPDDLLVDNKTLFYKAICEKCDKKNITESQLYNDARISRAVFSKIRGMGSKSDYIPKKNTVMQLCIALELSFSDAQKLMALVGYTLSDTIPVDKIVSYCLEHNEFAWNVSDLNDVIFEKTGESPFIKAA